VEHVQDVPGRRIPDRRRDEDPERAGPLSPEEDGLVELVP